MIKYLLSLFLFACAEPSLFEFPMKINVDNTSHPEVVELIQTYTDDLNNRLGCKAVSITQEKSNVSIKWVSLLELVNRFEKIKRFGGISFLEFLHIPPDNSYPQELIIWIAVNEGPLPDTRGWVLPNTKEIGNLYLFWLGYFAGLFPQNKDPSKITYNHPNSTAPDLVGQLIFELEEADLIEGLCK